MVKIYLNLDKIDSIFDGGVYMKRITLVIIGLAPLPIGLIFNYLLMTYNFNATLYWVVGILFYLFWGILGFMYTKFTKSRTEAILLIHIPAFIDLLLVIYQEAIFGRYWMNIFGTLTQLFYLPMISLASRLLNFLSFITTIRVFMINIIAFFLLVIVFYTGSKLRDANYKSTTRHL